MTKITSENPDKNRIMPDPIKDSRVAALACNRATSEAVTIPANMSQIVEKQTAPSNSKLSITKSNCNK